MSAWLSWGELGAGGVAADIAGATLLALSFMSKTPKKIAQEAPLWGMRLGNPDLARSLVRQRVEAWFGLVFLVVGFIGQLAVYVLAHGNAGIAGWRQDIGGGIAVGFPWLVGLIAYSWAIPLFERTLWQRQWELDSEGRPAGDELAEIEQRYGPET